MSPRRLSPRLIAMLAAALTVTACGAPSASDGQLDVVASFYPLQYVAAELGGDEISVQNLVKPGVEPHDFDPSATQVAAVAESDLVLYLSHFQPAIDEIVAAHASEKTLDVATVQPLRGGFTELGEDHADEADHADEDAKDPHIWLDPTRLAAIADAVATRLSEIDRHNSATYSANAADLRTRLEALDAEYRAGLTTCEQRTFVVSHNAFGYLAERYDLEQRGIAGLSPDAGPSAGKLRELTEYARTNKVRVIFFERLASDETAKTLADEVGAKTDVLDPLEGLEPGSSDDYFSVMRSNLSRLRAALGCR